MSELERYMVFNGIAIAIPSTGINYSYVNESGISRGKARRLGACREMKHRNWVHDSIDPRCSTLIGIIASVKSYENALGINIIGKGKHTKSLGEK